VIDAMDDGFGHWLAGFADGEGCFFIGKNRNGTMFCRFRIALRADDAPILAQAAERTGLGRVLLAAPPSQRTARATWNVGRKAECLVLVELFERYPLRAKKRRDFEVWARAVRYLNEHPGAFIALDTGPLEACRSELAAIRQMPEPQHTGKA
jgi:hypothetical protein